MRGVGQRRTRFEQTVQSERRREKILNVNLLFSFYLFFFTVDLKKKGGGMITTKYTSRQVKESRVK